MHAPARDLAPAGPQAGERATDAAADPTGARALLQLQRLAGNRAVLHLLGRDGPGTAPPGAARPHTGDHPVARHRPLRAAEAFLRAASTRSPGTRAPEGFAEAARDGVLAVGAYRFGRHPDFPRAMGQTYYARKDIEIWPSFNVNVERSWVPPFDFEAKPRTTDAAGNAWPVLATPENEEGYKMPSEHPRHPGKDYYIRVSATAASKIVGAEAQHVADLDAGWSLTGFAAKTAINQTATAEPATGDSVPAAKSAAIRQTMGLMGGLGDKIKGGLESGGRLEDSLGPMMDNAFTQSKTRRDDSGKHRIPIVYVTTSADDTRVLYEADPDAQVDTQATSEVVNLGTIG
jgi:hypothetical protein